MTTVNRQTRPLRAEERLIREHMYLVGYAVSQLATRIPRHVNRDDLESAGMAALASRRPRLRSRSRRALRPLRQHPHQGRAARRAASCRLGHPLRPLPAPARSPPSPRSSPRSSAAPPCPSKSPVRSGWDPREVDRGCRQRQPRRRAHLRRHERRGHQHRRVGRRRRTSPRTSRSKRTSSAATWSTPWPPLPERLRQVIIGSFLEDKTMATLAEEIGVTESRISQMRTEALALLQGWPRRRLITPKDDDEVVEETHKGRRPHPNAVRAEARRDAYRKAVVARSSTQRPASARSPWPPCSRKHPHRSRLFPGFGHPVTGTRESRVRAGRRFRRWRWRWQPTLDRGGQRLRVHDRDPLGGAGERDEQGAQAELRVVDDRRWAPPR